MKSSIQQIRAQCATDVRKRDVEMQKLKTHLGERQRSKKEGVGTTTISISPFQNSCAGRKTMEGGDNLGAPGYSLKQETTDFLTQLCQNLSDENDALIHLSERTIQTLKELQGLTESPSNTSEDTSHLSHSIDATTTDCPHYDQLSMNTDVVLEQLRTLLTNPSFVPLEEVEVRDNEISRLRDGWEKMESRWQEAVAMMDGWHRRLSDGNGTVNISELKLNMPFQTGTQRNNIKHDIDAKARPVFESEGPNGDTGGELHGEEPEEMPSTKGAPLRECSGNEQTRRDNSLGNLKESEQDKKMATVKTMKTMKPGNMQQRQRKAQLNANSRGQVSCQQRPPLTSQPIISICDPDHDAQFTQTATSKSTKTNVPTFEVDATVAEQGQQRKQTNKRSSSSRALGRKTRQKIGDSDQNTASAR